MNYISLNKLELKCELMINMCYQLNFMSKTEPTVICASNEEFQKCTAVAMWKKKLMYCLQMALHGNKKNVMGHWVLC